MDGTMIPGDLAADAELADLYYKRGERAKAADILEKRRSLLLGCGDLFLINKLANKIEFLRGADVLASKPLKLEVALTDRCNLSCLMCLQRTHAGHDVSDGTSEEIKLLLPYLEVVNWIGGEVLLSPRFGGLFDAAARYPRLRQNIITNGLLIDDRWAEKFASNRTSVCVSMDGFIPETYERVRKGAGFAALVAALTRLQKAFAARPVTGFPDRLVLNFVLMRCNCGDLEHAVDFARRFGAAQLNINALLPFEPAREYLAQSVAADPELARWYLDTAAPRLLREGELKGVKVNLSYPEVPAGLRPGPCNASAPRERAAQGAAVPAGPVCPYPWSSFFADSEGRVKPYCGCGGEFSGNVHRQRLSELWNSEGMRRSRALAAAGGASLGCRTCAMRGYSRQEKLLGRLW